MFRDLKAFGYSREDLKFIIKPMAEEAKEPVGSMGNDTPPAAFSQKPQLPYNYFKQLFAQVTNPAIDSIREELVMGLESFVGSQKNILDETPAHAHKLFVKDPVLANEDLEKIRGIQEKGFKTKAISLLFPAGESSFHAAAFKKTLDKIAFEAEEAIKEGYSFVILTDRGVDKEKASIPALLATGAVHHYLVKKPCAAKSVLLLKAESRGRCIILPFFLGMALTASTLIWRMKACNT